MTEQTNKGKSLVDVTGLFKVEAIKPLLTKPKNVLDMMELLRHWP